MLKQLLIISLLACLPLFAQAQRITGTVQDSSGQALVGATVMLVQAEDSVLASFVLTDGEGQYKLISLKPRSYLLKVSFLGYAPREQEVKLLPGQKELAMEPIVLLPEDLTLDQVNIEAEQAPIRLNNDTIEYKADVFGAQPGEVVEDLLKKLPGVDVDENGDIQAQGERVNKVLVDGKEFFSDDPKIATKNLPADAIDKVQVFDEKSDAEEISGVDDGQVNQTINLELKEDKKSGAFGTIEGGYGTDNRYKFKGNINRFSPKLQLSAVGLSNNINEDGFSIDEFIQFMGGLGSFMDGGSINIQIGPNSGIPIQGANQNGIFTTHGGGINGNFDLSKKVRITTNYMFSGLGTRREEEIRREQFLTEDFFTSINENRQSSQFYNNRISTSLRFRGDSISRFRLSLNAGIRNGQNFDSTLTDVFGAEDNLENSTRRFSEGSRTAMDGEVRFSYLTRVLKKGRTLSVSGNMSGRMDGQDGLLNSLNTLFPMGQALTDTLSQEQDQQDDQLAYGAEVEFSEPLGKNGKTLRLRYSFRNFDDSQNREVYDLFPERQFNTALSNQFMRDYLYQNAGLAYSYNGEKANFQIGLDGQLSNLQGLLISLDDTIQQDFQVLLPSMRFRYRFKDGLRTGIRYQTNFREPSVVQLQPFVDNRDPFNLYQGNPALRPEYAHNLSWDFLLYDQFTFMSLFAFLRATYTQNPIVEAREVDSLFRQIRTPVNVDNSLRVNGTIDFNTPIRPLKVKIGLSNRAEYNRGITFINGLETLVNRLTNTVGVRLENRKKKVWDGVIGARFAFNTASYSEASQLNRSFLNQTYYADLRVNFLKNWILRGSFDWAIYAGGNFADDIQVPLLKASIARQLFNKKVRLELEAFDILNQNLGITRRAELNYIEDGNSLTLRRYFMFKLSYTIGKSGDGGPGGGTFIIDRR